MRWFKHMTGAITSDPFIHRLVQEHKAVGYMIYFGILELMGANFRPESPGVLNTSWIQIQTTFRVQRKTARTVLKWIENEGKFRIEEKDNILIITCPKFTLYADKYTARLLRDRAEKYPLEYPQCGQSVPPIRREENRRRKEGEASNKQHTPEPDDAAAHLEDGGASEPGLLRTLTRKILRRRRELGLDPKTGRQR